MKTPMNLKPSSEMETMSEDPPVYGAGGVIGIMDIVSTTYPDIVNTPTLVSNYVGFFITGAPGIWNIDVPFVWDRTALPAVTRLALKTFIADYIAANLVVTVSVADISLMPIPEV
jgi:hypothetical protein